MMTLGHKIYLIVRGSTLAKIVFGWGMLFDLSFTTNYKDIINNKQKASDLNVDCENSKRIRYGYKLMI